MNIFGKTTNKHGWVGGNLTLWIQNTEPVLDVTLFGHKLTYLPYFHYTTKKTQITAGCGTAEMWYGSKLRSLFDHCFA